MLIVECCNYLIMRIAIIGAGPSGFFVAGELLKRCPDGEVHLFEKRAAPYGLVRYGVAPDHQLTRRAIKMFDQIAGHARFHYLGNVEVGRDIALDSLCASYHAVVICTGAEMPNRPDIPGAQLKGAVDALSISRWVNGEPDAFSPELLRGVETAVVIGNGNVALDAARMLIRPAADWVGTDMAPHAMEALTHHRIKRLIIAGRRGPGDVSFTEAEALEVASLPGWDVLMDGMWRFEAPPVKPASGRRIEFKYDLTPVCLLGDERVAGVRFSHTNDHATVEVKSQLVIFATGHRGIRIDPLPFDAAQGIIPNDRGRVLGAAGYYVCGWIKRGAKGLIGQNRKDAIETVNCVVEDQDGLMSRKLENRNWSEELTRRGHQVVTWQDWRRIDAEETQRGSSVGRPRINFTGQEILARLKS